MAGLLAYDGHLRQAFRRSPESIEARKRRRLQLRGQLRHGKNFRTGFPIILTAHARQAPSGHTIPQ